MKVSATFCLVLAIWVTPAKSEEPVVLKFERYEMRGEPYGFLPEHFAVTPENTWLVNNITSLLDFYPDGTLKAELELPPEGKMEIVSFAFIPRERVYVVCVKDQEKDDDPFQILAYDEQETLLGISSFQKGGEEVSYFRQMMVTNYDEIFINVWEPDYKKIVEPPMLQKLAIHETKGGYALSLVGQPFSRQLRESRRFEFNFKKKWLVEKELDVPVIFVADELQPRIMRYEEIGDGEYSDEEVCSLELAGWRGTHTYPEKRGFVPMNRWYFSFSKTVGFFELERGFLLAYQNPNDSYDWDGLTTPNLFQHGTAPFSLTLQPLDDHCRMVEKATEVPGFSFLMGTYGDVGYVFSLIQGEENRYRVESISFGGTL